MNTLSDAIYDLICKTTDYTQNDGEWMGDSVVLQDLVEEYVTRIKNELNVEKYLQ